MRSLSTLLGLCALAACASGAAVDLSATPSEVPADGVASALLVVRPTEADHAAADGTRVTLTTTLGSFRVDDPTVLELVKEVALGMVEARLFSPQKAGEAKVTASFLSATGERVQGEVRVRFVEPPAAARVTLTCDAKNLGGLVPTAPVLKAECRAMALDGGDGALPAARLGFMAEAGRLAPDEGADRGRRLVYSTGSIPPLDVEPLAGEPRWQDGARVRNPRDGVVTLVAYAERPSPGARGQGEPYVDADDSGAYERGELYFDMDGDSEYDPPGSGVAAAWARTRLVWSGAVATTPLTTPMPASLDIADGSSQELAFALTDANLNALAAGRGGSLSLDAGVAARVSPPEIAFGDALGFKLTGEGAIEDAALASGWMHGVWHRVWVEDLVADSQTDESFSLTGTLLRSWTPGVAGGIAPPHAESFPPIAGVLRAR